MSTFNQIDQIISDNPDLADATGGKEESLIISAEHKLGIKLPNSYRSFLKKWGSLAFGPDEFYGVLQENFETSKVPDAIWFTLKKRTELGLPLPLVIVFNNEGVEYYCLNTTSMNKENECEVVTWRVPESRVIGRKAKDFSEFLLERIQSFLDS